MSRPLCPRVCIAISVGVILGLIPLVYGWKAVLTLPEVEIILPLPEVLTQRVAGWRAPLVSYTTATTPITLLFVGDIMLDREVATRTSKAKDLSYPFRRLPPGWFASVDYAVANLEGPLTDTRRPPEKSIDFQFDPIFASVLREEGIDGLSQANNHALDQGREGYNDSRKRLRDAGFLVFGDQVRDDETALATTTIRGQRFAFVGFNTTDNSLDRQVASTTLALARTEADHVIAFMHWGPEYRDRPAPNETDTAKWLIDHGVDVVIGGHPHWVQGFEVYKDKPIVYSLGNFVFDQDFSRETRQGLAVKLTFDETSLYLEPIPLQIDKSQPHLLEGEERAVRLQRLAEISAEELKTSIQQGRLEFEKK